MTFPLRSDRLAALQANEFDVLVVGGGITGAAVARDAAARGLSVALLEREDWASGTSCRSSKLVHGGLRYLRSGQLRLVFESLAERSRLSRLAAHLVRPAEFLIASLRGRWARPLWLHMGLALYDLLTLGRPPRGHRRLSPREVVAAEPLLDGAPIIGGALYADAQTDDARLTLENVLDAASLGAVAVSRVDVEAALRDSSGRVSGIRGHDVETGRELSVSARVTVNATGPWSDDLRIADDPASGRRLRLSKGVHVTVSSSRMPVRRPVAIPVERGRFLFAIPNGPVTLLGTTDTDFSGSPDRVAADRMDVDAILKAAAAAFPSAPLTARDVVATFAGLRPLVREPGESVESTSREEAITVSPTGLVTVTGGKLTTHRRMGEKTVDRLAVLLARQGRAVPPCATRDRPFPGNPGSRMEELLGLLAAARDMANPGLTDPTVSHLAYRYGSRAAGVIGVSTGDRSLGRPLVEGLPDIDAEVVFAAREEDARTVGDVLIRRTHLFWQAPRQGLECAERVARLLARELGWSSANERDSVDAYGREVEGSRKWSGASAD